MRCKRCGELLEPRDTHCPVCGKTVSTRRKAPAQKPAEAPIKLPQLDRFAHIYDQDTARSHTLQMVTIGAVALAVVLLVMVLASVGDLKTAMDDLRRTSDAQLQAMQNQNQSQIQQTEPTVTEAQTEPVETQDPMTSVPLPLSRQDMEAVLTLYTTTDNAYASAEMDLGDFEDQAAAWVSTTREDTVRKTSVAWILGQSGDRLDMDLSAAYGIQTDITLTWTLAGDTFDGLSGAVCTWEYRTDGGEWTPLPTDHITAIAGGCEVHLSADGLAALLAQGLQAELRCRVSMTHADGGSMKLLAQGIALDAAGLAVNGDLLD